MMLYGRQMRLLRRIAFDRRFHRGSYRTFFSRASSRSCSCSWNPGLLEHGDLHKLLPWGLVDQEQVIEKVIPRLTKQASQQADKDYDMLDLSDQMHYLYEWMLEKTPYARVGGNYFQQVGTSHAEFIAGAKHAYQFVANMWNSDHPLDSSAVEGIATPALAELLCQVHQAYLQEHKMQPMVTTQPDISALVIKAEMEEGRAHKPGQILGLWDEDEFWIQLLIGAAGPEAQLMHEHKNWRRSQMTGSDPHIHLPHRLVAHVLFLLNENFQFQPLKPSNNEKEDSPQQQTQPQESGCETMGPFPTHCHVWEFEADAKGTFPSDKDVELQWRVRNINSALTPRAGRVLKSDGLVERHLGRWEY